MAYTINATMRADTGKSRIRKMRHAGSTPAVMYGHGEPSVMLTLNTRQFARLLDEIRGHSPIVDIEIEGRTTRCIIKTLQRNPVDSSLLHVDFQKVHADEKITVHVPVIVHGTPVGVKQGGMLDHLLREVPVRATIDRIPEHFEIDVTELSLGKSVHIADLAAEGLEFTMPPESPVVTVLVPRKLAAAAAEKAEAAAAAEAAEGAEPVEPEVIGEKKAEGEEEKEEEGKEKKPEKKAEKKSDKKPEKKPEK